jgi:hypothetical protein
MKQHLPLWLLTGALLAQGIPLMAQKSSVKALNPGASFLMVNPDARSSGTGDATTGLEADANSLYGNAAKIVFAGDWGISASYSPWMWDLNNIGQRTNLGYLSGFKTFNNQTEGIGVSVRYFTHGNVTFRDDNGQELETIKPHEYAIDASYARRLGDHMSIAISLRYIRSDLGQGTFNSLQQHPATAVAGDVGIYYENRAKLDPEGNRYCWGLSITNIGNKLHYTDDGTRGTFLPINLRLGGGYTFVNTEGHQFTLLADVNKLMIPTPPVYKTDGSGNITDDIAKGKDPNRGVAAAMFTSFYDAPGGFHEEMQEFTMGGGLEYSYQHQFFVRTGYFYENPMKGNRQHFSAGIGTCIKGLSFDMAYIMPTDNSLYLRRTLKFSLMYHIK